MTPYHPAQTEETLEKARVARSMASRGVSHADIATTLDLSEGRVSELVRNAREEDLDPVQPRALGAYIFGGGFTEGVKRHFDVVAHLEDGDYGVETSRLNHPELQIFTDPDQWPVSSLADQGIELVYANPPCAPWSAAGTKHQKSGQRDFSDGFDPRDERVECVFNTFRLLEDLSPRVWAWESVTRAFSSGRALVDQLAERAMDLGYSFSVVRHNAFDCGAPQRRHRVFFVAHNVQIPWAHPDVDGPETVREALEEAGIWEYNPDPDDVLPSVDKYDRLWREAEQGERLLDVYERLNPNPPEPDPDTGRVKGRPGFLWRRLAADEYSPVCTLDCFYHPTLCRRLTPAEAKVLSGYPLDYEMAPDSVYRRGKLIQQAVLPPVGAWLASTVREGLDSPTLVGEPEYTLYDFIRQDRDDPIPLEIGDGFK